ncbi:putative uncharacterized protein DDB_G0282269 [Teleopsis dalmanni]|uniref:putative uncharacterized protein DDB_G0282269 n=1 Tax=Teleopsis dalmanni TaxID=139649 RepID=UPI0018CEFF67|nr:putative uncharacterized protein DDB_G0282269 [Teleopsis dalmanni]
MPERDNVIHSPNSESSIPHQKPSNQPQNQSIAKQATAFITRNVTSASRSKSSITTQRVQPQDYSKAQAINQQENPQEQTPCRCLVPQRKQNSKLITESKSQSPDEGREVIEDLSRSGRPLTSNTEENMTKIKKIVQKDRRMTEREIARDLNISNGSVHHIGHETRCSSTCTETP